MVKFTAAFSAFTKSRTGPITTLALLLYLVVYVILSATDQLAPVPSLDAQDASGISLDDAFEDLHQVVRLSQRNTQRFH